ncbi:hypothetical protein DW969_15780 [Eubacterium sp. AM47-9]|nr:hypothetical protein DW969_15780 [Eubacterium sp. AM47-9]
MIKKELKENKIAEAFYSHIEIMLDEVPMFKDVICDKINDDEIFRNDILKAYFNYLKKCACE